MMDKQRERRIEERILSLQFIQWLHEHRPLPSKRYDYQVSITNRLSQSPTVGVYVLDTALPEGQQVLGGMEISLQANWDILDGIRHLFSEATKGTYDVRDYITNEKDPEH